MGLNLIISLWLSALNFLQVDTVPMFKGGEKRLHSFVETSLIYPEYAKHNCLQGTIQVSFQLNRKGKVFSSRVHKGYGIDLDAEALRVVRLTSGKWIVPAGFDTTQAIIIPINFSLKEYNCNERSPDEINKAIDAYRARQDLTKAVMNYYEKKNSDTYSPSDESKILSLKYQLGYDERFFDQLLKQGLRKLKQGDKEGACEDFEMIRKLGSAKSEQAIRESCR